MFQQPGQTLKRFPTDDVFFHDEKSSYFKCMRSLEYTGYRIYTWRVALFSNQSFKSSIIRLAYDLNSALLTRVINYVTTIRAHVDIAVTTGMIIDCPVVNILLKDAAAQSLSTSTTELPSFQTPNACISKEEKSSSLKIFAILFVSGLNVAAVDFAIYYNGQCCLHR